MHLHGTLNFFFFVVLNIYWDNSKKTVVILYDFFSDGNPITGEGYEPLKPAATPAQHVSAQSEPAPEQKKASRVPPGGYSSGLW